MRFGVASAESEQLADAIEAAASRDIYRAAPPALAARTPCIGGATALIAPTLRATYFNRVIGLGNGAPATAADIDEIIAEYAAWDVREYWIHVGHSAQPPTLATQLTQRGFTVATRRSWAKFLRGVEPPPARETQLTAREATAADADAVAAVVCAAYGLSSELSPWFAGLVGRPRWRVWLVERAGAVVATGSLFVDGDTAWLGVAATLAPHRGLGAQSALLAARIRAAAELGCNVLATETGEPSGSEPNPSLANIRRAGFTQIGSRLNYASPESASSQ